MNNWTLSIRECAILAGGLAMLVSCATPTLAWKQFQDSWQEVYLSEHTDEEFIDFCREKAKCHICHQGRKKSNNNPYGERFVGRLSKDDRKDKEKIAAAIKEIGQEKSNPDDEASPLFDDLIASSRLPGGDLEEVKREPKK